MVCCTKKTRVDNCYPIDLPNLLGCDQSDPLFAPELLASAKGVSIVMGVPNSSFISWNIL